MRLVLNRPEVRNAFDDVLVEDLYAWAAEVARNPGGVRVVVLSGAGKAFCAGGDLAWMRRTARFSRDDNLADARRLAAMYDALDRLPVPLVGRIHGAALGGGAGLAAVCDTVVAASDAVFGFTEVKLGIVPGAISPYVLAKIGRSAARALFLTGTRFDAARALAIGLVHHVVSPDSLDDEVARVTGEILSAGPEAVTAAKQLIRDVWRASAEETAALTADAIATRRASAEGQEGIGAFLEKRKPKWAE
jgi:methylglutaconyl-CoA hydratase